MYQDSRGFFHQDHAGESIVCAAANAMTAQRLRGENQAFVLPPDYRTALKEIPLERDFHDAITKQIQKLHDESCGDTKAVVLPESPTSPPDPVNHPPHYTSSPARCLDCGRPIECIDVIEHMPANLANAVKYAWRCGLKDAATQELRKAVWYLEREIQRIERERARPQA